MLKPDASKIGCSELLKENSNFHEKACQEKNASILSFLLNSYENSNFHEKACQEKNASILSFLLNSYFLF
ncbi:uncharacterized protein Dmul_37000 [Desulfococcus multivorans]|nr:uncharacterized protein Dmul_37000 [Desulfococcus multivorans]